MSEILVIIGIIQQQAITQIVETNINTFRLKFNMNLIYWSLKTPEELLASWWHICSCDSINLLVTITEKKHTNTRDQHQPSPKGNFHDAHFI